MKLRLPYISALLLLSSLPVFSQVPGTKLWNVTITTETFEPTPASSPAIGPDGTIYVGSTDPGGKGRLYAINPNGTTNWTCKTGGEIRSSPAIGTNGQIYFGSLDGVIWSLNPDGTTNWTVNTGMQVRSSPAIALDGTIYIGYGSTNVNNLLALSPNGTTNWIFTMGGVPSYSTTSYQFSSPSVGPDGTIYVGSLDKRLYAINPDGSTNWVFFVGANIFSSPTIGADGTIYLGADSRLWAIGLHVAGDYGFRLWARLNPLRPLALQIAFISAC
jgi:large repetitive protein